jgi:superfamily II DNA or RNA helicase
MPISWRGTLQQYVGRLHRLHDGKKVVEVYDYVDSSIQMLARMFDKWLGIQTLSDIQFSRSMVRLQMRERIDCEFTKNRSVHHLIPGTLP